MLLVSVTDLADGSVQVVLRITEEEEVASIERLRTQAMEGSPEFWGKPIDADDPVVARRLQDAQFSGREYHPVILGRNDPVPNVEDPMPLQEQNYFSSYDSIEVHRLMLEDASRMGAYLTAIASMDLKGRVAMDVGAGTGILSLALARAGASRVLAVEAAPKMARALKKTVELNDADIEVHSSRVESLDVDTKVDTIVSEWMGFYLLHESMLDSVIAARDKFLRPGGSIVPSKASLWMALVSLPEVYARRVTAWEDMYSFNMSALQEMAVDSLVATPLIDIISPDSIVSAPVPFASIDLHTITVEELSYLSAQLTFTPTRDAKVHGICCYFDVELSPAVTLSTAPAAEATHWKQSVFMLGSELSVEEGTQVECLAEMCKSAANPRHYSIVLSLPDASGQRSGQTETLTPLT